MVSLGYFVVCLLAPKRKPPAINRNISKTANRDNLDLPPHRLVKQTPAAAWASAAAMSHRSFHLRVGLVRPIGRTVAENQVIHKPPGRKRHAKYLCEQRLHQAASDGAGLDDAARATAGVGS